MKFEFKEATRSQSKLRLALMGMPGSGKTYSALRIAKGLGERIAVIDTEAGSSQKYAGDIVPFKVLELTDHSPRNFVGAIKAAERAGFDVIILDSLSHAWMGQGGALEMVEDIVAESKSKNSFAAWRTVTPEHRALIEAMLGSKCHIIATMRVKVEYALVEGDKGKTTPSKIGLAPVQRDSVEYEFDVVGDLDNRHNMRIVKTRYKAIDGKRFQDPGEDFAELLRSWLSEGAPYESPSDKLIREARESTTPQQVQALRQRASEIGRNFSPEEVQEVREAFNTAAIRIRDALALAHEAEEAERALRARDVALDAGHDDEPFGPDGDGKGSRYAQAPEP